jgi:hypothetical protein
VNDSFEKKVRAAAIAGWWVVLIGYALLIATWFFYLGIRSARPEWVLRPQALALKFFGVGLG